MTEELTKTERRKQLADRLLGVPRSQVRNKLYSATTKESRAQNPSRKNVTLTWGDVTDYDVWNPVTVSKLKVSDKRDCLETSSKSKAIEVKSRNSKEKISYSVSLPRLHNTQYPVLNFRRGFSLEDINNVGLNQGDGTHSTHAFRAVNGVNRRETTSHKSSVPRLTGIRRSFSDMDKSIAKARLIQQQRSKEELSTSGKITVSKTENGITSPPFRELPGKVKNVYSRHRDRPSTTSKYFNPSLSERKELNVIDPRLDSSHLSYNDSKQSNIAQSKLDQSDYISLAINNNGLVGHRYHPKVATDGEIKLDNSKNNKIVRFGLRDEIFEYDILEVDDTSANENNSL